MSAFHTPHRKPIQPSNPNFKEKVKESFLRQGPLQTLGGQLSEIGPGFVEIHLPYTEAAAQQHGLFHGGIIATVADAASGYASYTVLDVGEECLSAEYKINFLYPARGSKLIARGQVIKIGRRLIVAEATVSIICNQEEIDCALMLHTVARVKYIKDRLATIS